MSNKRINQRSTERCLLTEIAPYETPILFSNWGSFNYFRTIRLKKKPVYLAKIFRNKHSSIPYKFRIRKDSSSFRTLSLIHPKHSESIVDFYKKHDILITKLCKRSAYSLRAPSRIAKFYVEGKGTDSAPDAVEDITADTAYASSYFKYSRFSHLYKFFYSDDFTELEKRFNYLLHADIVKCFPSIYTHSISWAVRGKTQTKENLGKHDKISTPFDVEFDKLIQEMNYKETNGIPVGPELSRIFSEIILQRIDQTVCESLKAQGLEMGHHYWCCRYIDDYFIFINTNEHRDTFFKTISVELEKFKLYLNTSKKPTGTRPFISDVSALKIRYSDHLKSVSDRIGQLKASSAHAEINRLRAIFKGSPIEFSSISNFLMAAISRQISAITLARAPNLFDALYIFLDLAFYVLRMDMRVSSSYKITSILLNAINKSAALDPHERSKILDKIAFELRGALESAISQDSSVECMNLLIAYSEISESHPLPVDCIEKIIARCREAHNDEYSEIKRLTYFEIATIIYIIRNNPIYKNITDSVLADALIIIEKFSPYKYAESSYLLLDLVACPFLKASEKETLVKASMRHENVSPPPSEIKGFTRYVSTRRWYFDWNLKRDLRTHLKKKELLLAY